MEVPFLKYNYHCIKAELIKVIAETIRANAQEEDAYGRKMLPLSHIRTDDGKPIKCISLTHVNGEPSFCIHGDYYDGAGRLNLEELYSIYNYLCYLQTKY